MLPLITSVISSLDLTDFIAIIGCVTGCISFFLCVEQRLRLRFSLKFSSKPSECVYFEPTVTKYESICQAIAHIQIWNTSAEAISIAYIDPCVGGCLLQWRCLDIDTIKIPLYDTDLILASLPIDDNVQPLLPLRIESYDVKELVLFFPNFPDAAPQAVPMRIRFGTPKGDKFMDLNIRPATTRVLTAPPSSHDVVVTE